MESATPKLFVIYRLSIWIPTPFRFREACNSLLLVGSVSRRECLMNPRSLLLLLLCVSLFYACFPHFVRISCLRRTKHFLTNYLCPPFFFFVFLSAFDLLSLVLLGHLPLHLSPTPVTLHLLKEKKILNQGFYFK